MRRYCYHYAFHRKPVYEAEKGSMRATKAKRASGLWLLEPFALAVLLILLANGARAADLDIWQQPSAIPEMPRGSVWSGFYMGAEAGLSQTATDAKSSGRTKELSRTDAAFGLFAGHNWEVGRVVLGVEAGAAYLGGKAKATHPTLGEIKAGSKWTATLKGRVGLPVRNFLPYLSAGVAASEHSLTANGKTRSSVGIGPVLGAGVEAAFAEKWRLRLDYSLTGIVNSKDNYNGTNVKRTAANHRLMIGAAYAF
ncbi:opacity protein-like surface antigen [Roseibium hamelinense]|uniref:Opacity protein-like surface antigen n=3 Tax=Roseibium hamelinense TaxID=150831 RepID=A0A562TI22_9HYPH|nr:opacity protein-like surface antigen [Roseibium hamelinense]